MLTAEYSPLIAELTGSRFCTDEEIKVVHEGYKIGVRREEFLMTRI